MAAPVPINLAVEDDLSEAVLLRILRDSHRQYAVGRCYGKGGFGYLKRIIRGLNNAAKGTPFLVLTDLDQTPCPPELIGDWLSVPMHHNLLFRVAVREVEAWILADAESFAKFFRIRKNLVPEDVESILDPKKCLIELARCSPRREIREDVSPPPNSARIQGPNYNGQLISFVEQSWDISRAMERSASLKRTVQAIKSFMPRWTDAVV